jgi:hypothetical protein
MDEKRLKEAIDEPEKPIGEEIKFTLMMCRKSITFGTWIPYTDSCRRRVLQESYFKIKCCLTTNSEFVNFNLSEVNMINILIKFDPAFWLGCPL